MLTHVQWPTAIINYEFLVDDVGKHANMVRTSAINDLAEGITAQRKVLCANSRARSNN